MSSSDRQGNLRLSLVDVLGSNIGGKVDVKMVHQILSDRPVFNGLDASRRITLSNLRGTPQGNYRIEIDPSAYLGTSRFININASGMTDLKVVCAIDPNKVSRVTFPAFSELPADTQRLLENSPQVLSFAGQKGPELYAALDEVRKANVLNLTLRAPELRSATGGRSCRSSKKSKRFAATVSLSLRRASYARKPRAARLPDCSNPRPTFCTIRLRGSSGPGALKPLTNTATCN